MFDTLQTVTYLKVRLRLSARLAAMVKELKSKGPRFLDVQARSIHSQGYSSATSVMYVQKSGVKALCSQRASPCQNQRKITKRKFPEIDPHVESLLKNIVAGKHVLQLQKDTPVFSQAIRGGRHLFYSDGQGE